ncbi:probable ubiquitin-conjugating enzyme E2 C isoform X1 [Galendromus occidentalis]|uniref:Probable ubiquitin-conjugating enzyme E2 C isoform X1 n=1 Tax=Galendromus occidentalis TaxID=34638 RepID=A0AAJ7L5L0_9ACAR|nr:probable ubiquitin-conjugating enzyme E2 C isoform X1 [Galendromus occidentalis]
MSTESKPRASQALAKRLQDELMALTMNPEVGVSAFPDGDTLYRWVGTIEGPINTAYDGLTYKLTFVFPSDYPFKPPTVMFRTPCFHPNVSKTGGICLDILSSKWSAMLDIRTILISIRSLLAGENSQLSGGIFTLNDEPANLESKNTRNPITFSNSPDPNINSPLNTTAATLWADQKEFRKVLLEEYNRDVRKVTDGNS